MVIYAGTNGFIDQVPVSEVSRWEEEFLDYIHSKKQNVWDNLEANKNDGAAMKKADNETTKLVREAIEEFNKSFKA